MKVRWGGPPTYILSRVPRKLSSWLKQVNTTASFPPSRVFQQVALVFSYVSAFHLHLARRLTFRSNRRLERRMIGCSIQTSFFYSLHVLCVPRSSVPEESYKKGCHLFSWNACVHLSAHTSLRSLLSLPIVALLPSFHSLFTPTSFIQYVPLRSTHCITLSLPSFRSLITHCIRSLRSLHSLLIVPLRFTQWITR